MVAYLLAKQEVEGSSPFTHSKKYAGMAELADAADLKSAGREVVRVRVPLSAPRGGKYERKMEKI